MHQRQPLAHVVTFLIAIAVVDDICEENADEDPQIQ
jgi:hypothetical protein